MTLVGPRRKRGRLYGLYRTIVEARARRPVRRGRCQWAFVHVPKTAGTSVALAVGLPKKQHLTTRELIGRYGRDVWDRTWSFAFVRNPWDRVASHYRYQIKRNYSAMRDCPVTFRDWVRWTYGVERDPLFFDPPQIFATQTDWLVDAAGEPAVSFVGRFENLPEDFAHVAERIGVAPELPHRNPTPRVPYQLLYDRETRDVVGDYFADDCERFGYSF